MMDSFCFCTLRGNNGIFHFNLMKKKKSSYISLLLASSSLIISTMWSDQLQGRTRGVVSSSSSSSSSSKSSPSSSSILQPIPRRAGTMDEVWNNITHCQNRCTTETAPRTSDIRGLILQDFLGVPLPKQIAATPPPAQPPMLPPATILSLNTSANNSNDDPAALTALFPEAIRSPSPVLLSFCGNTWLTEKQQLEGLTTDVGVQQKRMIKNRESAARSRARKQAYTKELEAEVRNLYEENAKLKRQHEELKAAMAAHVIPLKNKLQRTSSAPF